MLSYYTNPLIAFVDKDLILGRKGSRQCFHLPRRHSSASRRREARKGPGLLAACGPRWMSPRSFQVPWLVLDLRNGKKNLNPRKCILSRQFQCIFILTKLPSDNAKIRIFWNCFSNLQGIFCRGKLLWAKEGSAMGIWNIYIGDRFFFKVNIMVFTWRGVMSNAVISSSPPPSSS